MDQQIVRETLTITSAHVTKADKVIGARFNEVAMLALNQAEVYLLHGPETARLAVTKQFLGAISRLSAVDTQETLAEHRAAFMREITAISKVTPHLTDADSEAITTGTYDQDNES